MADHHSADIQPPRALATPPDRRPQGTRQRLQILRGWEVRLKEGGYIEPPEFFLQHCSPIDSFPSDAADTPGLF